MAGIGGGGDAEPGGKLGPQPVPAEDVAIDDVEGLVATGGAGCCPMQLAGQLAGVGYVGQPIPLHGRAWEDEGAPSLATDAGIDSQGGAHVHDIADGVADDGVRTVDAPRKTVSGGGFEQGVFLGVVEILDIEPGHALAEGCLGQGPFA